MAETKFGKTLFRKWKTASGVIICARADLPLADSFVERILLTEPELAKAGPSTGRGDVLRSALPNGISYVLRPYRRGGMVQHLSTESFLPIGPLRPMLELEILAKLYDSGIKVPRPLFALVQYGMLNLSYSCAIATEEVSDSKNYFEVQSSLDDEQVELIATAAGFEAGKTLALGVFHRDLHPGNVLFRSTEDVFIIDFDKALRIRRESMPGYADKLTDRWSRAVNKYRLRDFVKGAFAEGVRLGIREIISEESKL